MVSTSLFSTFGATCITFISMLSTGQAYIAPPALNLQHPRSLRSSQHPKFTPATLSPLFGDVSSDDNEEKSMSEDSATTPGYKKLFAMLKPKSSEKMSSKEMIKKMGLNVFLSYGWVSNMSYCVTVSVAWFVFSTKTGLSPLAKGQWKPFLAVYAGFYVFNNFVRPFRLALSVAVSKYFDMIVEKVQAKLRVSKALAVGMTVFFVNIVGTCSFMALGILGASVLAGVPIFPPKPLL
jgi:hypothetical protein